MINFALFLEPLVDVSHVWDETSDERMITFCNQQMDRNWSYVRRATDVTFIGCSSCRLKVNHTR